MNARRAHGARRWRWVLALLLAPPLLLVGIAVVNGPLALSLLDWMAGGGRGVAFAGAGLSFGRHGEKLDVYRPSGTRSNARLPVVVFLYGGGWRSGTRQGYAFAGRALASRGFVAIVPDYRKVPAIRFPAFLQDNADAVRWARDHAADFGGDPDRIGLVGHSAGAYAVAMLALDRRWLKAAGVPEHAIGAAVGLAGPYDFYPFDSDLAVEAMKGAQDPGRTTQPIRFARADAPPMLLATGTADETVRPRNSEALAERMHAMGGTAVLKRYPGLGHADLAMALTRPFRGKGPVLMDVTSFLHRHLDRAPAPPRR